MVFGKIGSSVQRPPNLPKPSPSILHYLLGMMGDVPPHMRDFIMKGR